MLSNKLFSLAVLLSGFNGGLFTFCQVGAIQSSSIDELLCIATIAKKLRTPADVSGRYSAIPSFMVMYGP